MANPKIIFTGVDQASAVVSKVAGGVDKLKLALTGLASAAVVGVFKGIVDDLDRLEESAQSAGVAVETLSALRYAATFAGVGAEDLDEALKKLNVKLTEAAGGGKEAVAVFRALGIAVTNSSGQLLTSDEALAKIADKFASFRDGPEKAALAVELFGRSGTRLIPFLNQGAAGLERMKAEAEKLGIVIGSGATTAASKFADQLDRLAAVASAAKVSLFLPVIEGLSKMVEEFNAARSAAGSLAGAFALLAQQSAQTLADPGAKIEVLNRQLAELQARLESPIGANRYKQRLADQKAALEQEKKFLQEIQRNRTLAANAGLAPGNEGRQSLATAPRVDKRAPEKEQITEAQRALDAYVDSLQRAIEKEQDLSEVERALVFLRDLGTAGQIPQVRELVLELAKKKDVLDGELALQKELARVQAEAIARDKQLDQQLDQFSGRAAEALKIAQTARLEARLAAGELFDPAELERMVKGIAGIRDEIEKTDDVAKELGLTFASSLGRWIEAPGETNFFKALLDDIKKLLVQMLIIKPLAKELEEIFKDIGSGGGGASELIRSLIGSLFGGGGGQDLVGAFASGTSYVPRTGLALVHQGEAIIPAGRNGGGMGGTIIVNVDAAADRARLAQTVQAAVRAGIARSVDSRNRGGSGVV